MSPSVVEININMRCIEIKLKHQILHRIILININMRCIEMNTVTVMLEAISMININMRCIEMRDSLLFLGNQCGLTLT